jgi:hypothetical protein
MKRGQFIGAIAALPNKVLIKISKKIPALPWFSSNFSSPLWGFVLPTWILPRATALGYHSSPPWG